MSKAKHTPLPWLSERFGVAFNGSSELSEYIKLPSAWVEDAWTGDPEATANVDFIVRACNSHYEMLEALVGLAEDVETVARNSYATVEGPFEQDWLTEDPQGYAAWKKARDAIAKAEGQ